MDAAKQKRNWAVRGYGWLISAGRWFSDVLLATIRIIWGWQFFQAGKGKLGTLDNVAQYFQSLHIKMPKLNAIVASSAECFGGLLLLLGLGTRLASVPLTIVMIVAYLTAERPDIHSMDDFVKATPFPFLFTVLVVLAFGPGRLSIDFLLEKLVWKRKPKSQADLRRSGD
jgi:putative oxidoreductase